MTFTPPLRSSCQDCACQQQCLLGRQDAAVRTAWAPFVSERRFRKGEMLQRQGEMPGSFKVVKVGTLLLLRSGDDGVERPVGMGGCGQTLGTPALAQQPATLSCMAVMPGRLCEVAITPLARSGLVTIDFLLDLVREHTQANARLADWARIVRVRGVAAQLAGALLQLGHLQRSTLVRLPSHTVLAALLATTRETIARALAQLAQQRGLVRHDRWHCEILREPLLKIAGGLQHKPSALRPPVAEDAEEMPDRLDDSATVPPLRLRQTEAKGAAPESALAMSGGAL